MIKTIQIGDHPVEINSSAGWLYTYREQFGHDILVVLMPALEAGVRLAKKAFEDSGVQDGDEVTKLLGGIDEEAITEAVITLSSMQLTTVTNIVWALAKNADSSIPEPRTWLNNFENFPVEEVMPSVLGAVIESSTSKKNYEKIMKAMASLKRTGMDTLSPSTESPSEQSTED